MKFSFRDALAGRGAKDCPRYGCLADDRFYYRVNGNLVDVAVAKDFDRWANSIDFKFSVPKTRKAFDTLMLKLETAARRKVSVTELGKELRL